MHISDIQGRFEAQVWGKDLKQLPGWKSWPLRALRIVIAVIEDLISGELTLRAMSLVFTTILSFVPLIAVSFSVLKAFGVHNQIEPFLHNIFQDLGDGENTLSGIIIQFVDNVNVGALGTVALIFLFITVVSLIQKVESAFNYVWHVDQSRSLAQRFSSYLSVLMVGPVLVVSALGLTATLTSNTVVQQIIAVEPFGTAFAVLTRLAPYLLIIAAFTFLYVFIPNTRVKLYAALAGGVTAGVLWESLGWLFAHFVATSSQYTAIYSSFAIALVFMLWLNLSWLILLVGSSVAFYVQNPEFLLAKRSEFMLSHQQKEKLALQIMTLIGRDYYRHGAGWTEERFAESLRVPKQAIQAVLSAIENARLLVRTDAAPAVYLPACALDAISIKSIVDAVRKDSKGPDINKYNVMDVPGVNEVINRMDEALEQLLNTDTLKDLALAADSEGANQA